MVCFSAQEAHVGWANMYLLSARKVGDLNVACIERDHVRKGRVVVQRKGSRLTKILKIFSDSSHHCRSFRTQL
jgi:hypothetical protein